MASFVRILFDQETLVPFRHRYPVGPLTDAKSSKSVSADSRAAPWRRAQAAMSTSVAGAVMP